VHTLGQKPRLGHTPLSGHTPLLGAALILLALTACAGRDSGRAVPAPSSATVSATVIDCGTFSIGLSPQGIPASAITCFVNAVRADHRARLRVTRSTTEGDPIPVTYVSDQDDVAEVRVETDSRQDKFGAQTVTHQTIDSRARSGSPCSASRIR
jgi:hypothetical protein